MTVELNVAPLKVSTFFHSLLSPAAAAGAAAAGAGAAGVGAAAPAGADVETGGKEVVAGAPVAAGAPFTVCISTPCMETKVNSQRLIHQILDPRLPRF